ncbi:MAG: crotonyl-CoA carboxylase/reductase [Leptospiraceae bacterium]|nr:crotonyl-CoA carboxylase/reductase [Leptospiraceae bacterium]
MKAQVIRSSRLGNPITAFQIEDIEIPQLKDDEVLVKVKSAGVNYNNVWAAMGKPIDVIQYRISRGSEDDFHIGGSDASGIVVQLGSRVTNVRINDEVVLHAGFWDKNDPWILEGNDPILSSTTQAWGYETNYGSFAEYCIVKDHQCLPKPNHLTWDEAASYMLSGATAYRMLFHFKPNEVKENDIVLIWGGSGGLGAMAIQLVKLVGGIPIAIVNNEEKKNFCYSLGAVGVINRTKYSHWGLVSKDDSNFRSEIKRFKEEIFSFTKGKLPKLVMEHPGEATLPTSVFVCEKGGMVVTCGATSGYYGSFDLRYLWINQKKIQGSHFASTEECFELNQLINEKKIKPIVAKVYDFLETGKCHEDMMNNAHPPGTMVIKVS